MQMRNGLLAIALAGSDHRGTRRRDPESTDNATGAAANRCGGAAAGRAGRTGQGRGQRGVFPAMQRPLADPAVIERGRTLYRRSAARHVTAPMRGADSWAARIFCDRSSCCWIRTANRSCRWFRRGGPSAACRRFRFPRADIKAIASSSTA